MYRNIYEGGKDYRFEEPYVALWGDTIGCGCCSKSDKLTKKDLELHIKELKVDLEIANKMMEKYFK